MRDAKNCWNCTRQGAGTRRTGEEAHTAPSVLQSSNSHTDDEVRRELAGRGRSWSQRETWHGNYQETYAAIRPLQATLLPRVLKTRVIQNNRQL